MGLLWSGEVAEAADVTGLDTLRARMQLKKKQKLKKKKKKRTNGGGRERASEGGGKEGSDSE